MDKTKKIGKTFVIVIAIVAVAALFSSIVVTYEDEYKLVRFFGKVDRVITEEGVTFKIPFFEEVDTIPKQILLYDMAQSEVITKDKKTMVADLYVLWKIDDPLLFAQTLSGSVVNAEGRIDVAVFNALKKVIGSLDQTEVISARDGLLSETMESSVSEGMKDYGITIVSVETKRLDLPSDNKAAVYERMISERSQKAAEFIAQGNSESQIIKNGADKKVSIMLSEAKAEAEQIVAEGEAEYMRILSEAYNNTSRSEFYAFVRSLDAARLSLVGNNKTLILSSDSPLAQIFYNVK